MKRLAAITITALLTMGQTAPESCDPTALEAADIRPGDGGVWISGLDAAFIPDLTPPGERPLPELPPMETLCMLFPGDVSQRSDDYGSDVGTWIVDVQDSRFLGQPAPDAKYAGAESANLRYTYRKPGSGEHQVSLTMTFEKLPMVQLEGSERDDSATLRLEDGTIFPAGALARRGEPLTDPYFLTRVDAQGLDEQPLCWDPFLRYSTEYHWLPCDWCGQIGRDFLMCFGDPRGCFY